MSATETQMTTLTAEGAQRNLEILRAIEKLGGADGYQKYLESGPVDPPLENNVDEASLTGNSDEWKSTGAYDITFLPAVIGTHVSLKTDKGNLYGSGFAFGMGWAISGVGSGTLHYKDWEKLVKADNFRVGGYAVVPFFTGSEMSFLAGNEEKMETSALRLP